MSRSTWVGREVAGFRVEAELGRGSRTVAYRVRRGDAVYAMKLPGSGAPHHLEQAFLREAALLGSVGHPGLAAVHEVGAVDGCPYLVMELVPGRRLSDLLLDGPLSVGVLVRVGHDVAAALAAVHRSGLVHRDVKPDNLLVGPDGRTMIVDFGLAARSGVVHDDTMAGTVQYCAPEQSGMITRPVDGRADLYALGAVLHECATGRPPFDAGEVGELLRLHASAPVPDPRARRSDLPVELAGLVQRLLAKDPDDRYASALDVAVALRQLAVVRGGPEVPPLVVPEPADPRSGGRLVGRREELTALRRRWERARAGDGGTALVVGAAGGGKTRLVTELAAEVTSAGGLVLRGKSDAGESVPLAPLREAVERHVEHVRGLDGPARAAAVADLVSAAGRAAPLLGRLSASLADLVGAPPRVPDEEQPFAAAVAGFFAALARQVGGLVLHLDDLQWLDDASVRVLRHLAVEVADAPLLVVGTARDDEASAPVVQALRAGLGDSLDLVVAISPLQPGEVAELVATAMGGMRIDAAAATALAGVSGGNPFALLEHLPAVVDAGLLRPVWGTWVLDGDRLHDLELSSDVAALVLGRVAGLDAASRHLLGVGAVLGARFDPGLVAAVAGLDRATVLDVVGAARWQHLVDRCDDGTFRFLHDRIREAVLGPFDAEGVRRVHARIAEVLDRSRQATPGADDRARAYALARHSRLAGIGTDAHRTLRSCVAAGRLALADHAPAEAVRFLEAAREAAEMVGEPFDADLLHALGVAQHRAGSCADAVETLRAAHAVSRDRIERARILGAIARVHGSTWSTVEQITTCEQALAELGRPLPSNTMVLALTSIVCFVLGQLCRLTRIGYGRARGTAAEELRLLLELLDTITVANAKNLNPPVSVWLTLRQSLYVNRLGGGAERARMSIAAAHLLAACRMRRLASRATNRAVAIAAEVGDPRLTAYVEWLRAVDRCFFFDDQGEAVRRAAVEQSRWLDVGQAGDLLLILLWNAILAGDRAEAEDAFERRRALVNASGQTGRITVHASEAALHSLRGEAVDATAHLERMREPVDLLLWEEVDIAYAAMLGAVEQHDLGPAFDDAVDGFDRLPVSPFTLVPAELGVYVYRAYGRIEQCRSATGDERARRLAEARRATVALRLAANSPLLRAHLQVCRAALRQLGGDHAGALALLDRKGAVLRAPDAPLIAFEVARLRAVSLAALGLDGEARRQAGLARRAATDAGLPHRARRVAAELGVSHGTVRSTGDALDSGSFALGRYRQRLEAIEQVGLSASRVLDPDHLAVIALDETIRILGAERAFVFLCEEGGTSLVPAGGRDTAGADLHELTGFSATLVDRVRHTQEALVVTGTEEGVALGAESVVLHGLRSILVAPLKLDGRLLGVVYLDSRVAKGVFNEDDIGVLVAITSPIAVALETARAAQLELAVTAAHQQRDLAETMRHALVHVSGTLEPDRVLHRLVATVRRLAGGQRAWLVLGEPGDHHVRVVLPGGGPHASAEDDGPAAWVSRQVRPDRPLAALLAVSRPVAVGGGVGLSAQLDDAICAGRWLAVPLDGRTGRVGVLVVGATAEDAFDDARVEVAGALAGQGMVAYENACLFAQVTELARIDPLTGVANRRSFLELAERELTVAGRHGRPVAAVMIDVDRFKDVNDAHGHQVGDEVLMAVADRLAAVGRTGDLLGRYGGEEFAVLVAEDGERAAQAAERLRSAVADGPVPTSVGPIGVTISVGVAHLMDVARNEPLGPLFARADQCLYRAKRAGRNRVHVEAAR